MKEITKTWKIFVLCVHDLLESFTQITYIFLHLCAVLNPKSSWIFYTNIHIIQHFEYFCKIKIWSDLVTLLLYQLQHSFCRRHCRQVNVIPVIDEVIAIIIWFSRGLKLSLFVRLTRICHDIYVVMFFLDQIMSMQLHLHLLFHMYTPVIYFTAWQWVEVRTSCNGMHWLF